MKDNISITVEKCMDAIRQHVGTVELEEFIYYIRSQSFNYTKWQQEHYDSMTPEQIYSMMEEHSAKHPFEGKKAVTI